jgi:hypothetical protein
MAFAVTCTNCGSRFAMTRELFDRKVKGRVVSVHCKQCHQEIALDGTEPVSRSSYERLEPISDATPTAPLSRSEHPPMEGLWVVSFGEEDDRELTPLQIERALSRGEISRSSLVWREEMPEWLPLEKVPGLAELVARAGSGAAKPSEPPPKPAPPKPGRDREVGPFQSVGAGTLFAEKDVKPKPPGKREASPTPAPAEVEEEAPASSGTPDLRTLTTALGKPGKPEESGPASADFLRFSAADPIGVAPPNVDFDWLTRAPVEPEPVVDARRVETKRDSNRPAAEPAQPRMWLFWLLAGAGALVVLWILWRPSEERMESAAATSAAPTAESARVEAPAPPAAPSARVETSQPEPSAEPLALGTAPAEAPRTAARDPQSKPAEQKRPAEKPAAEAAPKPAAPAKPPPPAAAPPPSDAPPFDRAAASSALSAAAGQASSCRKEGDPSGTARVSVTFAPSGRVTSAVVNGPPFAGTGTGGCIASVMRSAKVPAFSGEHVSVSKTVVIQ